MNVHIRAQMEVLKVCYLCGIDVFQSLDMMLVLDHQHNLVLYTGTVKVR